MNYRIAMSVVIFGLFVLAQLINNPEIGLLVVKVVFWLAPFILAICALWLIGRIIGWSIKNSLDS